MNRSLFKVVMGGAAAIALALLVSFAVDSNESANAGGTSVSAFAIDMDTTGNTSTAVGTTETCGEIAAVAGTLTFDVVLKGVPNPGVGGYGASLLYNSDIIKVTAFDVLMIDPADNPHPGLVGGVLISFTEALPDIDGDFTFDEGVFGGPSPKPTGDGVALRITVEAVATGQTNIEVDDTAGGDGAPNVLTGSGEPYTIDSVGEGRIIVGDTCANVPTFTPVPATNIVGDTDCDGGISTRDNQALLRNILGQNPLSQTEPCPDPGAAVDGAGNLNIWGDWDCDGAVTTRDNQALLRNVLGQNPLSQTEPCPDIGTTTSI